jgi:hypothetical protein
MDAELNRNFEAVISRYHAARVFGRCWKLLDQGAP